MSSPLRAPGTATMLIGGGALALTGVALALTGRQALGLALVVVGFVIEIGGAWVHDLGHRRRCEVTHAMWGTDDRNRPAWLPSRRAR